jgi:hypothetical protein
VGEGTGIQLDSVQGTGRANFLAQGNVLKATQANISEGGILIYNAGGVAVNARIYSNLFYGGWSGCGCGFASVIGLRSQPGTETNWTVTGNTVDGKNSDGYGIFPNVTDDTVTGAAYVFDNIVVRIESALRTDDGSANFPMNFGYNDFFQYDSPPSYDGNPTGVVFNEDPMFVNRNRGNFRLSAASGLINMGSHLVPGSVSGYDADRQARVEQAVMDLGAYEFGSRKGCTIAGTTGPDVQLHGTGHKDVMCGLGGDDEIFGNGGGDTAKGGDGRDLVQGDAGPDRQFGGGGRDRLLARDNVGNDRVDGGPGDDMCRTDPGDERTSC